MKRTAPTDRPEMLDGRDRDLVELLREHTRPTELGSARRAELRRAALDGTPARHRFAFALPAAAFASALAAGLLAIAVLRAPDPTSPATLRAATADDDPTWAEALLLPVDPVGAVDVEELDELPGEYQVLASYLEP